MFAEETQGVGERPDRDAAMDGELQTMLAEWKIGKLSLAYADAVDRLDQAGLLKLFVDDAVMEGPGWRMEGYQQIATIIPILRDNYVSTWHAVHNQMISVSDGTAQGVTYSTARHLQRNGYLEGQIMTMTIRYLDEYSRDDGGWKFRKRKLIIDWTESATAQFGRRE